METLDRNRAALTDLVDLFRRGERFLLIAHIHPDGDALGSILGLGRALKAMGKSATLYCQDKAPEMYAFMPGADLLVQEVDDVNAFDAAVLLDCNEPARAGEYIDRVLAERGPEVVLAVMDHHLTEEAPGEYRLIDPKAAAAGELVYLLLTLMEADIDPAVALNLYVAICTDTGSFSFNNTTADVLATAAELVRLGASPWEVFSRLHLNASPNRLHLLARALENLDFHFDGRLGVMTVTSRMMAETGTDSMDTDGFVEYPRAVKGADLAALVRQTGPDRFKFSLRSKGRVNAAALAGLFGGGGHFQAAGFSIEGGLQEVKQRFFQAAAPFLNGGGSPS